MITEIRQHCELIANAFNTELIYGPGEGSGQISLITSGTLIDWQTPGLYYYDLRDETDQARAWGELLADLEDARSRHPWVESRICELEVQQSRRRQLRAIEMAKEARFKASPEGRQAKDWD